MSGTSSPPFTASENDETFRLLVQKSPIPMAVTDSTGRFLFLNDRFRAVLGYTEKDLPDMEAWWLRAYPDRQYREEILSIWRESMGRDGAWDGTGFKSHNYRVTCADGTERTMKIGGTKIADKRLHLFLDITKSALAEEEASRLREHLFQAQKMEAIGRLAAGVAHDFNNLLTSILGYSAMIRSEEGLSLSVREGIREIEGTAQRAADLTRRLLDFGRKQVLQPKVVDLHALIAGLQNMLRRLIGEKVVLACSLKAGQPFLVADPGRLEQVLVNLAVNARDAMPQGGSLAIETRNVSTDGGPEEWIELTVSDTGYGMAPEVKAHLFEPFFTTKAPGKGTGLGLSTVYGVVMQNGGRLTVRSEPGCGTSFRIRFPCAQADCGAPSPAFAAGPRGGTETILLVEDEETLLDMVAKVLVGRGYRVIKRRDSTDALALLGGMDGPPVDLLITDVVMPRLNGPELVERVLPVRPSLKVLFISGYAGDEVLPPEVLGQAVRFLQKPFSPDDLAGKVRQVLDR